MSYRSYLADQATYESLTPVEQLAHIESCDGCTFCVNGRAFGVCPSCGDDMAEALPPEGLSRCCGSVVTEGSPE